LRKLAFWIALCLSSAVASGADTCGTCTFPCARAANESFTLRLVGGRNDPGYGFTRIVRDTVRYGAELVQAYRLYYRDGGLCKDTLVTAVHLETVVLGLTLGKTPPLFVPVRPVAEYALYSEQRAKTSFVEVGGIVGYGGSDKSVEPRIGFADLYYGAEALVAPFGDLLGEKLALAVGGGVLLEGGRMRFPALGHLRYTFASTSRRQSARYVPDACRFTCVETLDTIAAPVGAVRRPGPDSVDRAAILVHERIAERSEHAVYAFLEGGPVFNGSFDGAGPDPSINRDDYGQWVAGAGLGIPIASWLHTQLAYRYARLNLRTPCIDCGNVFQVNTNQVHAVLLRVSLHWGW